MRGRFIFLLPAVLLLNVSCFDDEEKTTSPQAAITSFSLGYYNVKVYDINTDRKDTIVYHREGGAMFPFTIDQVHNRIYNTDSLSYGSKIDSVTVSVSSIGTVAYSYADNPDSAVIWESTDYIDFTRDLVFYVVSTDGTFLRAYDVDVNMHKVFPDSLIWSGPDSLNFPALAGISSVVRSDTVFCFGTDTTGVQAVSFRKIDEGGWNGANAMTGLPAGWNSRVTLFSGKFYTVCDGTLYSSADGLGWSSVRTGIKGLLSQGTESGTLWAVSQDSDIISTTDAAQWKSAGKVPAGFPDSLGVIFSYPLVTNKSITRSVLIGLSNDTVNASVWNKLSTDTVWTRINTPAAAGISLPAIPNIQVIRYDGALFATGTGEGSFRQSNDNGVTWYYCDSYAYDYSSWNRYMQLPEEVSGYGQEFACVTDSKGFIWIMTDDGRAWRGAINRLIRK
jgi:hypothetical protein